MQSSQERCHFHRAGHFTNPDVHAGFEFIEVTLYAKAWLFHEVSGEEAVHGGHDPWMFLDVAVTESEFGDCDVLPGFHLPLFGLPLRGFCLGTEPRRRDAELPLEGTIERGL